MGIVKCNRHGRQGIALASPSIVRAMIARESVPQSAVAPVRYTWVDDQYPPLLAWLEVGLARRFGDRVVTLDELYEVELDPACASCLREWLEENGVDAGPSPEERRFLRLREQLNDALLPRLQPTFKAISDAVFARTREPTGWGFHPLRERPFRLYAGARSASVIIEVSDRGASLVGTVRNTLFASAVPAGVESTQPFAIGDGAVIGAATIGRLCEWADEIERYLREGLASLA